VAESRQFGGGRVFGDKTPGNAPGASEHCAQCEGMLADALDGTLSVTDQAIFDMHAEHCAACGQIVADARRGAAWLEMLRDPAPEPPVDLMDRILAQTAGMLPSLQQRGITVADFGQGHMGEAALVPGYAIGNIPHPAQSAKLIPFPRRAVAAMRRNAFGQIVLQPRLAMTAAMAFFSVALTMNITGFHPTSLRASDLAPDNLWRGVISADTRVVRYYESLRVVYELESRVHDLQSAQDTDATAPASVPVQEDQPAAQPVTHPDEHKAQPQPAGKQPAPGPGTSRRDDPYQTRHVVVSEIIGSAGVSIRKAPRYKRRLV
jgi:Putative zinc-finger